MRNIVGLVFFAAGAWMLFSALARRRRVIAAGPDAAPPLHPSLRMLGDAMPPIILVALGIIGVKVALAILLTEAGQYFSLFDLAGFLFLLAGYGTSLVIRTRYRDQPR